MKTTLELPDELYREAKTRAAAQNRKVKDLVSEGLRALLASPQHNDQGDVNTVQQVLLALDEIQRCPPTPSSRTAELQAEARKMRLDGWSMRDFAM